MQERIEVAQYFGSVAQDTQHHLGVDLRRLAAEFEALFHGQQDFADAEQADDRDQEVEAVQQFLEAEGEAELAGHHVEADGGEREADHHRHHGLGRRFLAHADEGAEGQEVHRELLGRAELQRERGNQRGDQRDHDDGDEGADEGRR